jgi:type II secretory pathway predicted ATPase ExeA
MDGEHQRLAAHDGWTHLGPGHEEALARLEYVLATRQPLAQLTGAAGTGKSTVARTFADRLVRRGVTAARVDGTGIAPDELPHLVAEALRIAVDGRPAWPAVRDEIAARVATDRPAVVLLDHADALPPETRPAARRLSRLVPESGQGLVVVLVGRRLDEAGWTGGDGLHIELEPFTPSESRAFLLARLEWLGDDRALDDETLRELHSRAHGLPGRLLWALEIARLAAGSRGHRRITAELVRDATRELIGA